MNKELEALRILTNEIDGEYGCITEYPENVKNAYVIIKQALERNDPMKVKRKWDVANKEHYYICPNEIPKEKNVIGVQINRTQKYCPQCGQKLDWSEFNE